MFTSRRFPSLSAASAPVARPALRRLALPAVIALVLVAGPRLGAQSLTVSGSPSLTVGSGTPGAGLDPATDASSSYSVTTLLPNQKVVARLQTALPPGVTLEIRLAGATSAGSVALTTSDQNVLNAIPLPGFYSGTITYTLRALVSAGPMPTRVPQVELSVLAGP